MGEPPSDGGGSNLNVPSIHWRGRILEMPSIQFCQEISACSAKWLMVAFPFFCDMPSKWRQQLKQMDCFHVQGNPTGRSSTSPKQGCHTQKKTSIHIRLEILKPSNPSDTSQIKKNMFSKYRYILFTIFLFTIQNAMQKKKTSQNPKTP